MKDRKFYPRSLVTFLMATGFAVAAVTGTVLYVTPKGSIANWTGWTLGGLDKEAWGDVHIVTGALFLIAGVLHVYFNWKPLKAYIYSRATRGLNRSRELAAALALTAFVVAGAVAGWPPLSYILEFNEWAKTDLWATAADTRGTVPAQANEHDQALDRVAEGIDAALAEAATKVGAAQPARSETEQVSAGSHSNEASGRGGGRGGGSGFGRMTLTDLAARYGLDSREIAAKLAAAGIPFAEGEPLRDIAARAGMTPGDLGSLVTGAGER